MLSCHAPCVKHNPLRIPPVPQQELFISFTATKLVSVDFLEHFSKDYHVLTLLDHFSILMELFLIISPIYLAVVVAFTN